MLKYTTLPMFVCIHVYFREINLIVYTACQTGCSKCTTAGAGNCDGPQYCASLGYNTATKQCICK